MRSMISFPSDPVRSVPSCWVYWIAMHVMQLLLWHNIAAKVASPGIRACKHVLPSGISPCIRTASISQ
eukprot:16428537-Heterocapsa_arctica.AAC.1